MSWRTISTRSWIWRVYLASLALVTVIAINFFIPGSSIKCVQCSSNKTLACFDDPPPSRACEKDMKVCRIVRERWPNGTLLSITRECFPAEQESSCQDVPRSDGTSPEVHQKCQWTCNEDGCNPAPPTASPSPALLVLLLFLAGAASSSSSRLLFLSSTAVA